MTNRLSRRFALLFLTLALFELLLLAPVLTPLDAAFAQWIEMQRSCWSDYMVFFVRDRALTVLILLGGLALILLCRSGRWAEARHLLIVVLVGGLLCELLKTGLERPRPSVLSEVAAGNSFPSGHVTTALLVAGALGRLLLQEGNARWKKATGAGVLGVLVSLTIGQRLYLGVHWLTDIVGSVLVVGAWLCLTLPRPHLFALTKQSLGWFGILLIMYFCVYWFPALRLALPSPLTPNGEPVYAVSFGENGSRELLRGAWESHTQEPAGPITWIAREEASVDLRIPERQEYLLKIALRPMLWSKAFACFPLEISVNQHHAGTLLLYRGWREYSMLLDPRWIAPGLNTITFRVGSTFPEHAPDQRTVAFRHMRVFAEKVP